MISCSHSLQLPTAPRKRGPAARGASGFLSQEEGPPRSERSPKQRRAARSGPSWGPPGARPPPGQAARCCMQGPHSGPSAFLPAPSPLPPRPAQVTRSPQDAGGVGKLENSSTPTLSPNPARRPGAGSRRRLDWGGVFSGDRTGREETESRGAHQSGCRRAPAAGCPPPRSHARSQGPPQRSVHRKPGGREGRGRSRRGRGGGPRSPLPGPREQTSQGRGDRRAPIPSPGRRRKGGPGAGRCLPPGWGGAGEDAPGARGANLGCRGGLGPRGVGASAGPPRGEVGRVTCGPCGAVRPAAAASPAAPRTFSDLAQHRPHAAAEAGHAGEAPRAV